MDSERTTDCEVIVNGQGSGTIGRWKNITLKIRSLWGFGTDGEKFAVLAAIRRRYNPNATTDIRGTQHQTPAQVGRDEGFKELEYQHISPWSARITIVPTLMRYLLLMPKARIANAQAQKAALKLILKR
jgi:hypothetical protein